MALGLEPYEVFNTENEDAPPFAVMEIVRLNTDEGYIEVRKPTAASLYEVLIDCGNGVPAGEVGTAFCPWQRPPYWIYCKPADGVPATTGEDWGTEPGEWWLTQDAHTVGFRSWEVDDTSALPDNVGIFQLKVCDDGS